MPEACPTYPPVHFTRLKYARPYRKNRYKNESSLHDLPRPPSVVPLATCTDGKLTCEADDEESILLWNDMLRFTRENSSSSQSQGSPNPTEDIVVLKLTAKIIKEEHIELREKSGSPPNQESSTPTENIVVSKLTAKPIKEEHIELQENSSSPQNQGSSTPTDDIASSPPKGPIGDESIDLCKGSSHQGPPGQTDDIVALSPPTAINHEYIELRESPGNPGSAWKPYASRDAVLGGQEEDEIKWFCYLPERSRGST